MTRLDYDTRIARCIDAMIDGIDELSDCVTDWADVRGFDLMRSGMERYYAPENGHREPVTLSSRQRAALELGMRLMDDFDGWLDDKARAEVQQAEWDAAEYAEDARQDEQLCR